MFGHKNEADDENDADVSETDDNDTNQEEDTNSSTSDFVAHHTGLTVETIRPHIGHLDETPYEHVHAGYDARFVDHSVVPHREITHTGHGVQGHLVDEKSMTLLPTYDELLWAYQHGGFHHADAEGEVHHEDVAIDESLPVADTHHYYEHKVFDPHVADREFVLGTGDLHPADHKWHADHDGDVDWRIPAAVHAEMGAFEDHHIHAQPFWRGGDHTAVVTEVHHDVAPVLHPVVDTFVHHHSDELKHDIEHEYDELFHMIESETKHPIEHTEITYKTLPLHGAAHPAAAHTVVHE